MKQVLKMNSSIGKAIIGVIRLDLEKYTTDVNLSFDVADYVGVISNLFTLGYIDVDDKIEIENYMEWALSVANERDKAINKMYGGFKDF